MSLEGFGAATFARGWLRRGIVAGFIATSAMTVVLLIAYGAASALASWLGRPDGGFLARWLWALTYNRIVGAVGAFPLLAVGMHLGMGLVWALLYVTLAAPALSGPGWQRGLRFAMVPWAVSILVFFPVMGGGVLGLGLGAGPLPALGNLLLHAVYGIVLGAYYARPEAGEVQGPRAIEMQICANQGAAVGIVSGAVIGVLGGWWAGTFIDPSTILVPHPPALAAALFGGLLGAAVGATAGAFAGVGADQDRMLGAGEPRLNGDAAGRDNRRRLAS
ncbi:MAG: hypothetical protein HY660_03205 [Armatimonadetes bacterium]|nr:hypothetical protein [Armatimonadota bacterium]